MANTTRWAGRWSRRAVVGAGGLLVLVRTGGWAGPARPALALPKVRFQARVIGADDAPRGAVAAAIAGEAIAGSLSGDAGPAAFVVRGRSLRALTDDKAPSAARAVNAAGAIAGSIAGRAVVWRGEELVELKTLGGATSEAFGINGDGLAVGQALTAEGTAHAVLWQRRGTARDLSAPDVGFSVAYGINADGAVVGFAAVGATGQAEHAVRWVDGEPLDLGTLGGDVSQATAINASGLIVGFSGTVAGFGSVDHAVAWDGDEIVDLGVLGAARVPGRETAIAFDQSQARAVNADGWVVGSSASSAENAPHPLATLWLERRITDLNALIGDAADDLVLTRASGVDDDGRIVCTGFDRGDGDRIDRVILLTPR